VLRDGVVWYAKGALYGFCPRCGEPGEMRSDGRDRCFRKHRYPSVESRETPTADARGDVQGPERPAGEVPAPARAARPRANKVRARQ